MLKNVFIKNILLIILKILLNDLILFIFIFLFNKILNLIFNILNLTLLINYSIEFDLLFYYLLRFLYHKINILQFLYLIHLKIWVVLVSPWGSISLLLRRSLVLSMGERTLVFSLRQYLVTCSWLMSLLAFVGVLSIRGFHISGGSRCILKFGIPLRISLLGARPAIILRNSLRIFVFSVRFIYC